MKKILAAASFACLVLSCSKNSSPEPTPPTDSSDTTKVNNNTAFKAVSSVNLKNASNIVVLESNTQGNNRDSSNLFKVNTDGSLEGIFYQTTEGKAVTKADGSIFVRQMVNLNKDYLVMDGEFSFYILVNDTTSKLKSFSSILLRKSDGAIFDYGKFDFDMTMQTSYSLLFRPSTFTDAEGNIFYRSYSSQNGRTSITKLSIKNPSSITKQDYMPEGQAVTNAVVDNAGNVLYSINQNDPFRLKSSGGAISVVPGGNQIEVNQEYSSAYWRGLNGKLYMSGYVNFVPYIGIVSPTTSTVEKVWQGTEFASFARPYFSRENHLNVDGNGEKIMIEPTMDAYNVYTFNEANNFVSRHSVSFQYINGTELIGKIGTKIFIRTSSNDFYFLDAANYTINKINNLSLNNFDIYTMKLYEDGIVEFSALRFADGKIVLCQLNAISGTLTVLSEKASAKPVALERIK